MYHFNHILHHSILHTLFCYVLHIHPTMSLLVLLLYPSNINTIICWLSIVPTNIIFFIFLNSLIATLNMCFNFFRHASFSTDTTSSILCLSYIKYFLDFVFCTSLHLLIDWFSSVQCQWIICHNTLLNNIKLYFWIFIVCLILILYVILNIYTCSKSKSNSIFDWFPFNTWTT